MPMPAYAELWLLGTQRQKVGLTGRTKRLLRYSDSGIRCVIPLPSYERAKTEEKSKQGGLSGGNAPES